jgi:hypothetical protein
VAELKIIGMDDGDQRHKQQCRAQTNLHDVVHPNLPYDLFCKHRF